jgi:hypothetical protein
MTSKFGHPYIIPENNYGGQVMRALGDLEYFIHKLREGKKLPTLTQSDEITHCILTFDTNGDSKCEQDKEQIERNKQRVGQERFELTSFTLEAIENTYKELFASLSEHGFVTGIPDPSKYPPLI